jgi:ParB/RepB/Spo0J family partition protein
MPLPPIQSAHYQTVPLSRINPQIETFRITTREDIAELLESIRQEGLISPPLLIENSGSYTIVCGFRRVAACRKLGWHAISAGILEPDKGDLGCLRFAIADNAFQRPLNLIETSRALYKLAAFLGASNQLTEIAAGLGLPTNPSIIGKIKDLCLLPEPIQSSILDDTISLSMANDLAALDPDSAATFTRLFDRLKLSLNKQKEIITLVTEIARRENLTDLQVMQEQKLREIIDNEDIDRGQKGRYLRAFLRQRRFPRIVSAEIKYDLHCKDLKLGSDIKLIPPKDFEGTAYTLNLNFSNLAHLKELHKKLSQIIEHPSLKKILTE